MTTAEPRIAVVVLHMCGKENLLACLRSLAGLRYANFEVLLACNFTRDEELEKQARDACSKVAAFLYNGGNVGFAAGNNPAMAAALRRGADYVMLLNDDTEAAPDLLNLLADAAAARPEAGLIGPRILFHSRRDLIWFSGADFERGRCDFAYPCAGLAEAECPAGEPLATDFMTGCCVMASRAALEKVGLLDEKFFLYWEDSDWALRAAAAGFYSLLVPQARVWHKVSSSSGGNDSAVKAYHKTRGQLLFCGRHAPEVKGRLLLKAVRDIAWLLLKARGGDRVRKAAAIACGLLHHYAGVRGPGPAWLR
jgi:GT2 family glycosyltransferase